MEFRLKNKTKSVSLPIKIKREEGVPSSILFFWVDTHTNVWYVSSMFNHQAHWDRDLPQDKNQKLGSAIAVTCLIEKGHIRPKSFYWKNSTFDINKVNFHWKDMDGKDTLLFFSVETKGGIYEIAFSCGTLSWHINKLLGP
ncbi:MAG: hypothetical protein AAB213_02390 [Candidatus Omnitrophota bacterium]